MGELVMVEGDAAGPDGWDPLLDAAVAAPASHRVLFENDAVRVLEVILEPGEEEPIHHHRWPSVFVFDAMEGPIFEFAPDGTKRPPNPEVAKAAQGWNGTGCLVVHMGPQGLGRNYNASSKTLHAIRVEMKSG